MRGAKTCIRCISEARHIDTIDFIRKAYRDDIIIEGGILREDCAASYYGPNDDVPADEQCKLRFQIEGEIYV